MDTNLEKLILSIKEGDNKEVRNLLDTKPELFDQPSPMGVSFLMMALYYGKEEIARLIADSRSTFSLFEASALGDVDSIQICLKKNPKMVNDYSSDGFPALGLACFFNHYEAASLLINKGALINAASANAQKVMPIHAAASADSLELCTLLLDNGADVNARQQDDFTPLHAAAQNGNVKLVRLFLSHGSEVNARTISGLSPLQLAMESKNKQVIKVILDAGGLE